MQNYSPLLALALVASLSWACDSGEKSSDDSASSGGSGSGAGAPATAGTGGSTAGKAGSPGTAGASPATGGGAGAGAAGGSGMAGAAGSSSGLRLGSGGPFAFPQNKKPGSCTLTTAAGASASVQSAYTSWKNAFVTSSGAGAGLRVQRNTNGNDTVSEGIGYGMIAAVYLNDKATFDGLWAYAKSHFDANGLMNWHIDATGTTSGDGMGSATDGDEDMAWALLMASDQWSSTSYLTDGVAVINAMLSSNIASDGMLKPGDNWGGTTVTFPDYFSPAYFRVFAKATGNSNWSGAIIDRNYAILAAVEGADGLVPDKSSSSYDITGNYGYDACRTPWRIGMDYCFNAEPRAQAYLMKIGTFFNGVGAANIDDGYSPSGSATSQNKNMAFIGPAGVAGMAGFQTLLDGAFAFGANNSGGDTSYFGQSLRVLTMLMMSGNFVDFTKP
jgi:endo-1,4-beta-D-glucanase Y